MVLFNDTTAKRIGDELGIDWKEVDIEEFNKGLNFELKHGTRYNNTDLIHHDLPLIAEITWSHLKEIPDYYTRLEKMERDAELFWKDVNSMNWKMDLT